MPRINLLVSTTRQWNPGDDFISYGARRLLEAALGNEINFHLWDRNPDRAVDLTVDWTFRSYMMSNLADEGALELMDAIVLAGTPHWAGGMLQPIFGHLVANPTKPCFALGLGSSAELTALTEVERAALSRPTTVITARSEDLARELSELLEGQQVIALSCPAFLCAAYERRSMPDTGKIGLVLQAPGVKWQDVPEEHFAEILEAAGDGNDVEAVSVYGPEFVELKRRGIRMDIAYSFEASDYLDLLSRYRVVISTRLHGAIAAASLGIPVIVLQRGDYRVNSAQSMLADVLPVMTPADAFRFARNVSDRELEQWLARISDRKRGAWATHLDVVQRHVASYGPKV